MRIAMTMPDTDVLIVGAGPTGLMLACALAQRKVRFRIVEASPFPQKGSRGKGVQPRSLELFDDLGIADRVIAHGRFDIGILQHDGTGGSKLAPSRMRPSTPDAPYMSTLLIPQWRVEEALRDKLGELGGHVEFGVALTGFVQNDDSVSAQLADSAGRQQVHARWLVGCDGGKSMVRRVAGIEFLGETSENIRMMLGDVRMTGLDRDHWHMWSNAEGFLALCPLPSTDEFQLQASIAPGQEDVPSLEAFQRLVQRRTGNPSLRVDDAPWQSMWRANVRMVNRYRAGRVLLAGDAAHVHTPAGGQGMNTGMQDACNLGWKLAAVVGGADAGLIDTYEEERLPIASWVLGVSNELAKSVIATRTMVMPRNEQTLQLGLGYRGCSLSLDERPEGDGLRAGDRAPDAPDLLGPHGPTRIFDLLRGPHITLLAFGARWQPLLDSCAGTFGDSVHAHAIVQTSGGSGGIVDPQGHARRIYADDTLFVIRPDNYIGMVATDGDNARVMDYLRRITAR
jgi:2-polyprenyl-6-methoxyphenol hydroxylase-like FAD-dependent oxidoreductase